jgi:hypothetical protein
MELSFWSKTSLELLSAGFAILSIFYPYFGIPAAAIIVLLAVIEISSRRSEKTDFRSKMLHELLLVAGTIINTPSGNFDLIPYSEWSSKSTAFQKDALGNDYDLWKRFYDSIDARNDFFAPRDAFRIQDGIRLRRTCLENFLQLSETTIIQQSTLKKQFDGLVAKARETVAS